MIRRHEFFCLCSPARSLPPLGSNPLYGGPEWYETYQDAEEEGNRWEPVSCPLEPEKHKWAREKVGGLKIILPVPQIGDFIWTVYSNCVVTDRVLRLLTEAGFTGFRTHSSRIVKVRGLKNGSIIDIPDVWELEVTGKGGDAHAESGIKLLYACPGCGLTRYSSFRKGIVVDARNWDGSDFFTVNGYRKFILVTDRVRDEIVKNKLTNCAILRSTDIGWGEVPRPEDISERFMPSKLTLSK